MKKILFLFLAISLNLSANQDWPAWRGLKGDGIAQAQGILESWQKDKGPKLAWRVSLGDGFSGISAQGGILYTLFADKQFEYLIALNAKTGKKIWQKRIGKLYERGHGNGPRSTPTVHSGKIYAVSASGDMWCFNLAGKKIWNVNILKKFHADNATWGISSSPFIYKDRLLFNVGGPEGNSIVALNKNTGSIIWTCGSDKAGYSTPILTTIHSVTQVVFFTGESLLGVDIRKGNILWKYEWKTAYQVNAAAPICHNNHVFISSGYSSGSALIQILYENGKFEPKLLWKTVKMKNHFSSSILWKGYVYGFHNNILSCLEWETGEIMWRQRGFFKGTLIGTEGHMLILGEQGVLAFAKMNHLKYEEKGRAHLLPKGKYWTVPTIAYGSFYIRNQKEIMCFR